MGLISMYWQQHDDVASVYKLYHFVSLDLENAMHENVILEFDKIKLLKMSKYYSIKLILKSGLIWETSW